MEISHILGVIVFILGFVLVIQGGSILVDASKALGEKLNISLALMGAGILSLITTMPEIMVGVLATSSADFMLAIGNSLGSAICNFGVVLSVSFISLPSVINIKELKWKAVFFCVILIIFIFSIIDGKITSVEGGLLFLGFIIYMITMFFFEKKKDKTEDIKIESNDNMFLIIFEFFLGSLSIALGAKGIVDNVSIVGGLLHINQKIISLVIVSIGTSLPELVTALFSAKKGCPEMGIGNMIGANLVNMSLIIGLCSFIANGNSLVVAKDMMIIGVVSLFLISFVTLFPIFVKSKTSKLQGVIILILYALYVGALFFMN